MIEHGNHNPDRTELDPHRLTLNYGDTFAVFDRLGDIRNVTEHSQGLFFKGCRFLSQSALRLFGVRPELLSSTVREESDLLSADLTNPELYANGVKLERGTLHINRLKFLKSGRCFERISIQNFSMSSIRVPLTLSFLSDFQDLFELRGFRRTSPRGEVVYSCAANIFKASYRGRDGILRHIQITFPIEWSVEGKNLFQCEVCLAPSERREFELIADLIIDDGKVLVDSFCASLDQIKGSIEAEKREIADITSSNALFNHWVTRSKLDLVTLLSDVEGFRYPFAGVPWYNTVFGRDGIVTAIQCLVVSPEIARNVLLLLAKNQATSCDAASDAEPGKILHEMREGELVNLGEVPFKHYYGSVDSTPLFLWLAGLYFERTADLATVRSIWPNIEKALNWVEEYGDSDGDGFIEYYRRSANGLVNQGWKDSYDSVSHVDGTLAEGPIALCEVQGYLYQAKCKIAKVAAKLGKKDMAVKLEREAAELKAHFNEAFWDEERKFIALALDGKKNQVCIKTSNPGHCLATAILDPEKAAAVARGLMAPDLYSGWGVRTLSQKERRYNPMSYHNGSIWPHDTSIAAMGLALYGHTEAAAKICESIFEASSSFDMQRMPELFCGFDRRKNEAPILYPVACSPQAWAVASVYLILTSLLGIEIYANEKSIRLRKPAMPRFLNELKIERIPLEKGWLGLRFLRYGNDIGVEIMDKPPDWSLIICK